MKRHFLISLILAILVSAQAYEMLSEKVQDSATMPEMSGTTSGMDTTMDDTVPVLSQPEAMLPTIPMTEAVVASQMKTSEPMMAETEPMTMAEAGPEQTMEENIRENEASLPEEENGRSWSDVSAADMIKRAYVECVQYGSFTCVKPKVLSFLSAAAKKDRIMLTEDLIIEKTGRFMEQPYEFERPLQWDGSNSMSADILLEKIDTFLSNHEMKLRVPKEIVSGELVPFVPKFLLQNIPAELRVPLSESKSVGQERGILKKVVIPFLLGLKFKASALIPLALALIALKTWKALTLGLLSIVLSGAMVIFKFTKPKVVNYEVYHYPAATPVVEHPAPAPAYDHGWSRALDAQPLAYRAYVRS
ncbi:uncharacterized protein [Periplaneta americana]|uniref:uncharacterized protein n=1 Tax=Periplaneta americana TaxID=6978 RepID=UPI0037E6F942